MKQMLYLKKICFDNIRCVLFIYTYIILYYYEFERYIDNKGYYYILIIFLSHLKIIIYYLIIY